MNPTLLNGSGNDSGQTAPVTSHRLSALHSLHQELSAQRRSLISRLRGQLDAMSSCRDELRDTFDGRLAMPPAEPVALRLQDEYGMTPREAEVALLLADGFSNSALARRLCISPHTARHHTQRVLGKLGVHSRAEAGSRLRRW